MREYVVSFKQLVYVKQFRNVMLQKYTHIIEADDEQQLILKLCELFNIGIYCEITEELLESLKELFKKEGIIFQELYKKVVDGVTDYLDGFDKFIKKSLRLEDEELLIERNKYKLVYNI